jgi:processive 1,2-diacylglycerol beta-glucosyltransferase
MNLVAVLRTAEPGLLPLAKLTLDQAGIPYVVSERGGTIMQLGYAPDSPANAPPVAFEILVNEEDAAQARELVADLEAGVSAPAETSAPPAPAKTDLASPAEPAVSLTDLDGNRPIGRITDAQLEAMLTHLEKESADDREFYVTNATIDMLSDAGLDAAVVAMLRAALGTRDGMDMRWDV